MYSRIIRNTQESASGWYLRLCFTVMEFGENAVHKKKEQEVLFPYSQLLPAIHENSFLVHKGHLSFMYHICLVC